MPLTRRDFLAASAAALALPRSSEPRRPIPSRAQLEWQRDERALFLHFGVNTFTDREWGDGREDPASFTPGKLDTHQWARSARLGGFRSMILTAKHHDGFCLWPSKTTRHSVAASPWREGKGDLVREFTAACVAAGLKAGLYLSPWDRNSPVYGDSPRYNDLYCDQLTELLTGYGPIQEVWFDGANGEGPNGRRQVYDWPRFFALVRKLQPKAVMFSDAGPDVRWIGNERGVAGETNWSTMDPAAVPYPGAEGPAIIRALQEGDPNGNVWRPGETDVSIRPGWFYHPAEDARVMSVAELVQLYFTSVGRNSKLLLNVPPTREGLLHDTDAERLRAMGVQLDLLFRNDLAEGRSVRWRQTGPRSAEAVVDLGRLVPASISDLREEIERGQQVEGYELQGSDGGAWKPLVSGTTIGYRKLDRFTPVRVLKLLLRIRTLERPRPVRIGLFSGD